MREFTEFSGPMINWPRVDVMKDVPEVLAELHEEWKLCLATNAVDSSEEEIRAALRRAGLDLLLDKVYCFRKIGHKKPSRQFFEYVLKDLGVHRSRVIMIGDDFESDILGAVASGIHAIWFNEHSKESKVGEMFETVHDFKSLPQAVSELFKLGRAPPHSI
jgi:putative hydrolase of the HAD superfamily